MRLLQCALSYLALVLALPFLVSHPKVRQGVRRRLGLHPRGWPDLPQGPRLWVHGASGGDIRALLPTVQALTQLRPDVAIVASTITDSGRAIAEREGHPLADIFYVPYDLPGAVQRTLHRVRPSALVLEYTELWPNLIHAAQRAGIPIILHNGRFSGKRLGHYRWLFRFFGNLLQPLSLLLMRDDNEAERALQLGAAPGAVHVTGNTKFDNLAKEPAPDQVARLREALALGVDDTVWVAGSTHEGEEELLLDVYTALRERFPRLRLVIAPRYVERAERIHQWAAKRGLSVRRRSRPGIPAEVTVLDSMGELLACYVLADVVFVGGSFVTRGGQNILEPAASGKPVLFGPHMENFADAVQVLLGRGGIQTASAAQLTRVLEDLLAHPDRLQRLGETARKHVLQVRGAARRNAELIAGLLPAPEST